MKQISAFSTTVYWALNCISKETHHHTDSQVYISRLDFSPELSTFIESQTTWHLHFDV